MRVDKIEEEDNERAEKSSNGEDGVGDVDDLTAGDTTTGGSKDEEEKEEDETDTTDPDHLDDTSASFTLTEISTRTGIPYVTIARYARENAHRLGPLGEGKGKSRRYYPGAIALFRQIKDEAGARRGRGGQENAVPAAASTTASTAASRSRKAPRKPRVPRSRVRPTSSSASPVVAAPAKRRGRPRKNVEPAMSDTPPKTRGRRRVVARRNVIAPKTPSAHAPLPDDGTLQITVRPLHGAQSAFHRAHLTAQVETLQETIDHLTSRRDSLKMEINKLA